MDKRGGRKTKYKEIENLSDGINLASNKIDEMAWKE
jgi:hypothetical protein